MVPEIDTPGHSESWHVGYPDVTVYSVNEYMLDPTKNETFALLEGLFGEIADMFEDEYIHIGCDEVSFAGLNSSASIVRYMEANGMSRHGISSVQNVYTMQHVHIHAYFSYIFQMHVLQCFTWYNILYV